MLKRFAIWCISLSFVLAGCSSTRLTSVWADKGYQGKLGTVLVIGVSENLRDRRIFEDALVKAFKGAGVKALSSAAVLPADHKLDKKSLEEAARKYGVDAVMITSVVGVEENEVYYPPTTTYVAPPLYYRDMWSYYPQVYETYSTPGYTVKYQNVKLESNLYDAGTGALVWSAASEAFDPASDIRKFSNALASQFVASLREAGLIP